MDEGRIKVSEISLFDLLLEGDDMVAKRDRVADISVVIDVNINPTKPETNDSCAC